MRLLLWASALFALILSSCTRGAFQPVNTGREYGDPVPLMVSHIGAGSPHYVLQNVLCFDYLCRKKAGKKKAMSRISFEDFKKRIRKNAKKGMYKNLVPPKAKPTKKDSVILPPKDSVVIAPPAIAIAPVPPEPVLKSDSLIVLSDLLFELNSSKLRDEHITALDNLGAFLQAHPSIRIRVTGHTDNTGTERHNVALSTRRAGVVAEYLVDHGATLERITYEGFGSSQPITDNRTEEGRKRNRRVEVLLKNE